MGSRWSQEITVARRRYTQFRGEIMTESKNTAGGILKELLIRVYMDDFSTLDALRW
jgi:hypothetical protein